MRIEHLSLTNFRNYARLEWSIPAGTTVIHGANAQGKTSLLEAIYYLATSRSPHITADRQLISWMAEKEPLVLGFDQDAWAIAFDYHAHPLDVALSAVEGPVDGTRLRHAMRQCRAWVVGIWILLVVAAAVASAAQPDRQEPFPASADRRVGVEPRIRRRLPAGRRGRVRRVCRGAQ